MSQAFGAGKNDDLRKYFVNGVYFALAIAVIMTAVTEITYNIRKRRSCSNCWTVLKL